MIVCSLINVCEHEYFSSKARNWSTKALIGDVFKRVGFGAALLIMNWNLVWAHYWSVFIHSTSCHHSGTCYEPLCTCRITLGVCHFFTKSVYHSLSMGLLQDLSHSLSMGSFQDFSHSLSMGLLQNLSHDEVIKRTLILVSSFGKYSFMSEMMTELLTTVRIMWILF